MNSLPYSTETRCVVAILRPLLQCVVAILRPVCFYTVDDGRRVRPDLCRELGSIVVITPIAVEAWMSS
jgi:hypothetical protein